jgi:AcrR family transcriptional regulator
MKHTGLSAVDHRLGIINAARDMFYSRGYPKVSMEDIAERAGVSRVSLYNYFTSKLELFTMVMKHTADRMIAELTVFTGRNSHKTLEEKIELMQPVMLEHFPALVVWTKMMDTAGGSEGTSRTWKILLRNMRDLKRKSVDLFTDMISEAQQQGEIRKNLPPRDLAQMLMGFASEVAVFGLDYYQIAKEVFFNGVK